MPTRARWFGTLWKLRAPLALLVLTLALWVTSVISIIWRDARAFDLTLLNGALVIEWGSTTSHRHYCRHVGLSYQFDRLLQPWREPMSGTFMWEPYVPPEPAVRWWGRVAPTSALLNPAFWNGDRLGLRWPSQTHDYAGYERLEVPILWCCLVPLAWLLIAWRRTRHRTMPGHCQKCGYNLHKNSSGVCPECGVKIADQPSAPARQG